jgi:aryl-alcohol dehydrogenase-like predicted oxidoreductase
VHRQPEEDGVLDACRELNVALVAYRPLERGRLKANTVPRTSSSVGRPLSTGGSGKATSKEEVLQETLRAIAQQHAKGISQVALNWLLRRDEHVIPIPGTTNKLHALENVDTLSWKLSHEEFAAIDQASSPWKC